MVANKNSEPVGNAAINESIKRMGAQAGPVETNKGVQNSAWKPCAGASLSVTMSLFFLRAKY